MKWNLVEFAELRGFLMEWEKIEKSAVGGTDQNRAVQ
jgi:hypothetical protein